MRKHPNTFHATKPSQAPIRQLRRWWEMYLFISSHAGMLMETTKANNSMVVGPARAILIEVGAGERAAAGTDVIRGGKYLIILTRRKCRCELSFVR